LSIYIPIYVALKGKACLVVGGGKVAERKIKNIISASPDLTVVSPSITPYIEKLASSNKLVWKNRKFLKSDIKGKFIVFAATDDEKLNKSIGELCEKKGVLVNVVKPGSSGNFIVPSSVKKGKLSFSFSTSGEAPFFTALIKKDMQKRLALYHKLFNHLKPLRSHLLTKKGLKDYNNLMFEMFFNDKVFRSIEMGDLKLVDKLVEDLIATLKE